MFAIDQARDAEEAQAHLTVALGGNLAQLKLIQQTAGDISAKTIYDDDDLAKAAERLLERGVAADDANRALKTIADTASALHKPLEDVADEVAQSFGGTVPKSLGKIIPSLKNLTEEELRAGKALEVLAKAYDGKAEAFAATEPGKEAAALRDVAQAWEDIGTAILPLERTILPQVAKLFQKAADAAKLLGDAQGRAVLRNDANRTINENTSNVAVPFENVISRTTKADAGPDGLGKWREFFQAFRDNAWTVDPRGDHHGMNDTTDAGVKRPIDEGRRRRVGTAAAGAGRNRRGRPDANRRVGQAVG